MGYKKVDGKEEYNRYRCLNCTSPDTLHPLEFSTMGDAIEHLKSCHGLVETGVVGTRHLLHADDKYFYLDEREWTFAGELKITETKKRARRTI